MAIKHGGSIAFPSTFVRTGWGVPIDQREVVTSKSDLITDSVWIDGVEDTRYQGMIVHVNPNPIYTDAAFSDPTTTFVDGESYILINIKNRNATDYSGWLKIGSGGGGAGGNTSAYDPYSSPVYQFYSASNYSVLEGGYRKTSLVSTGNIGTTITSNLRIVTFTTSGTNPCVVTTTPNYTGNSKGVIAIKWDDLKTAISGKTSLCLNVHGSMNVGANVIGPSNTIILTPTTLIAFENGLPSNVIPLYAVFQKYSNSTSTTTSNQRYRLLYFVTATMNKLYLNSTDGYYYSDGGNVSDMPAPGNGRITFQVNNTDFSGNTFTTNQSSNATINIPINLGSEETFVFYKYNGTQTTKTMLVKSES